MHTRLNPPQSQPRDSWDMCYQCFASEAKLFPLCAEAGARQIARPYAWEMRAAEQLAADYLSRRAPDLLPEDLAQV